MIGSILGSDQRVFGGGSGRVETNGWFLQHSEEIS